MSFTIICDNCSSKNVTAIASTDGREISLVCGECEQVEDI